MARGLKIDHGRDPSEAGFNRTGSDTTRGGRYGSPIVASKNSKPPRGKVRSKTPVPKAARPADPVAPRRRPWSRVGVIGVPVLALLLAIGVGVFLGVRSSRTSDVIATPTVATTATTDTTQTAQTTAQTPKELFLDTCATCHTLAAAGATGGIGPNLDQARPTRQRVLNQIRTGALSGVMPANLLTGTDADRVAAYVAQNAGKG
jgi:mono/diheme cytochrome c family protein